jgi:hypothetical protein
MEDLLREILAPIPPASPSLGRAAATLPAVEDATAGATSAGAQVVETAGVSGIEMMDLGLGAEWMNGSSELEMQRILVEMGVGVGEGYEQAVGQDGYELSELDMEMGWESMGMSMEMGAFSGGQGVGVF